MCLKIIALCFELLTSYFVGAFSLCVLELRAAASPLPQHLSCLSGNWIELEFLTKVVQDELWYRKCEQGGPI